jgi:TIR domain-containing protein
MAARGGIFISYRRGDAAGHAGRLHDELVNRLGPGSVFQDVASIAPGERFLDTIDRSIGSCDVVLAVIGRRFTEVEPDSGRSRLHDPNDIVRRELEAALRSGRRIVPVLVDRATPCPTPSSCRPACGRCSSGTRSSCATTRGPRTSSGCPPRWTSPRPPAGGCAGRSSPPPHWW